MLFHSRPWCWERKGGDQSSEPYCSHNGLTSAIGPEEGEEGREGGKGRRNQGKSWRMMGDARREKQEGEEKKDEAEGQHERMWRDY